MTQQEESALDAKMDNHFRNTHPELPKGRDYRAFSYRFISAKDRQNYRKNFDNIWPKAPGAKI